MLYGISLIYGLSGTLDITNDAMTVALSSNSDLVVTVTIVLMLAGLLFKLSLVPFHVWTPDVYEAAPTPLVSFLSVAPKAAVILVLMRLAGILPAQYFAVLGGIALISMTIGNVAALWQSNARRLLAYSSIAQAGYLLVGIAAYSRFGFEAAVFYTAAYLIINLAAFFPRRSFTTGTGNRTQNLRRPRPQPRMDFRNTDCRNDRIGRIASHGRFHFQITCILGALGKLSRPGTDLDAVAAWSAEF